MRSLMAFMLTVGAVACTSNDSEIPRSLQLATWEFVRSLPDSVCAACTHFYVHPEIVREYDGPMIDFDGTAVAVPLELPQGHQWHDDTDTVEVRTIRDAEPLDGQIALAARVPTGQWSNGEATLVVEIYVGRGGRWLLEGSIVATGVEDDRGWSFLFQELNWT